MRTVRSGTDLVREWRVQKQTQRDALVRAFALASIWLWIQVWLWLLSSEKDERANEWTQEIRVADEQVEIVRIVVVRSLFLLYL